MSLAARSGPPVGDPYDGPSGRHEVPFGPEISWPYGFRQMDPESRDLIESAYRSGPGYQQPALDDYGYGDPGYSDPSYEGPKTPYNSPAFPGHGSGAPGSFAGSGYRPSDSRPGSPGRSCTPPAGPQPPVGRPDFPQSGGAAYPEHWYDHPRMDDRVSRSEEVRHSTRAHPRHPGGAPRRLEPQGPGHGQRPGSGHPKDPGRPAGHGQQSGNGQPRGPQMNAGRKTGQAAGQPGSPSAAKGTGFLAAPVGLLTPPEGTRVDALRHDDKVVGAPVGVLTAPDAGRRGRQGPVRPGHGLDGPEITASWPTHPATDLDSFDNFWRDDADEEYSGLFGDRGAEFERADAKQAAAKRSTGRRRGRSSDHRLWLALGGVVVVAAGAIFGILKFEFPSHSGPVHTMSTPNTIGDYTRTANLERQTDVAQLRDEVIMMSSGQASDVQSAVYKAGNSAAGNTEQIIMFIGGHLANADPAASISSFTQKFSGAHVVSAGTLGGEAACVQEGAASNAVAMCAWFDNDSFGEIVSPTMNATALGKAMQTVRPSVEHLAQK